MQTRAFFLSALVAAVTALSVCLVAAEDPPADFGAVFDEHWERLRDDYPYFELYDVDWEAERSDHRPRAIAAADATEFAWEIARLLSVLKDSHVFYMPPMDVMSGWSIPDLRVETIGRKAYVIDWGESENGFGPPRFRDDPRAYPEVVSVQGNPLGCGAEILVAGPVGTMLEFRLRWPDGTETDEEIRRPDVGNLPPPKPHFGERWVVNGRLGSVGYLRVKTFSPEKATLGREGKMTPILRARLKELLDTDGLILDLQGNGGGVVGASDPFLSHFLKKRRSYKWGNSGGRRTLVPRSPRYRGEVVVLVDGKNASGGEWAARILRDAGRATIVGEPTAGAEAAVKESTAADGSVIHFSAWPMVEPGVTPFQDKGVELDHDLPLTIEAAREHGYDPALERVRRQRFARALEILDAPEADLEGLLTLAKEADRDGE